MSSNSTVKIMDMVKIMGTKIAQLEHASNDILTILALYYHLPLHQHNK